MRWGPGIIQGGSPPEVGEYCYLVAAFGIAEHIFARTDEPLSVSGFGTDTVAGRQ